jgi:glycosyltransferase involved in cell wall biosynthesis
VKFSVVTLSFNQDRFLQHTLDSIRISSPHQLQYVIVDAGSTDGSRKRIERNRHLFHRIIFEKDHGPADGLNKGFAAATPTVSATSGTLPPSSGVRHF